MEVQSRAVRHANRLAFGVECRIFASDLLVLVHEDHVRFDLTVLIIHLGQVKTNELAIVELRSSAKVFQKLVEIDVLREVLARDGT